MTDLMEKCLGTTEPTTFNSLRDLDDFFTAENLSGMFGDDVTMTGDEIEDARDEAAKVLVDWAEKYILDCDDVQAVLVEYTNDPGASVETSNGFTIHRSSDYWMTEYEVVAFAKWIERTYG
jgi:hypothetical protein